MSNLTVTNQNSVSKNSHFSNEQVQILKNSICKGVSDEEFQVFLMACAKTQLDPFMKQIYAVKRKAKLPDGTWGETMTIQTGIDGYRLIAERTGLYAPGPEPTYTYDSEGKLMSACSYIKKQTSDGTWHIVSASAYIDEYMQCFVDKQTGVKKPTGLWQNMPRTMLAKCAEAQALRKAFPSEMSGVYTKEEMSQADTKMSLEQAAELNTLLEECDQKYKDKIASYKKNHYNTDNFTDLPCSLYPEMRADFIKKMEENHNKQVQAVVTMEAVP